MIFRYPGGKTKLLPEIEKRLFPLINNEYAEGFVGGGSVLISVANKFHNAKLFINDKDDWISSFWKTVIASQKEFDKLIEYINIIPTVEMFNVMRKTMPISNVEKAFYAVFFNRTTFSGMVNSGMIGGKKQGEYKIGCRYNSENLIKDLRNLRLLLQNRLTVFNLDIIEFIQLQKEKPLYLDPPYFNQGKNLYKIWMKDQEHINLANILRCLSNWILSYDDCNEIRKYYSWANVQEIKADYSILKWNNKKELLITKDNKKYYNEKQMEMF